MSGDDDCDDVREGEESDQSDFLDADFRNDGRDDDDDDVAFYQE